jgi:hypothetical protein
MSLFRARETDAGFVAKDRIVLVRTVDGKGKG